MNRLDREMELSKQKNQIERLTTVVRMAQSQDALMRRVLAILCKTLGTNPTIIAKSKIYDTSDLEEVQVSYSDDKQNIQLTLKTPEK